MVRRDFLKISLFVSAAVFMQFNPLAKSVSIPVEAESQGKLYRGTSDGKIYVSANAGKNWQLHTSFGSGFSVQGLATDFRGLIHARLGFGGHSFELALAQNSKTWRTV